MLEESSHDEDQRGGRLRGDQESSNAKLTQGKDQETADPYALALCISRFLKVDSRDQRMHAVMQPQARWRRK